MSDLTRPRVIFVTDPLCSWCWAMLPAAEEVRDQLLRHVDFDLLMAGLQIGSPRPVDDYTRGQLRSVWTKVHETTGQSFSMQLPADETFMFHSEIACRSVEYVRGRIAEPPWDYFHSLQHAFFIEAKNINDESVLSELCLGAGLTDIGLTQALHSNELIEATRAGFNLAKKLGAHALPCILIDLGEGPKLVSGGYLDATYLRIELDMRMNQPPESLH